MLQHASKGGIRPRAHPLHKESNRLRRHAAPPQPRDGGHARVVPACRTLVQAGGTLVQAGGTLVQAGGTLVRAGG
eukprot:7193010-Prymnesium_polylepis.1